MANYTSLRIVQFGRAYGGLATVGYAVYTAAGAEYAARTTAGVAEKGTSTGIYGAVITLPDDQDVEVRWDTGGASPVYASESVVTMRAASSTELAALQTHGDSTWATATTVGLSDIDGIDWEIALASMLAHAVGVSEVTNSVVEFKRRDGMTTVATVTMGNTAGTRTTSVLVGE